jgi:hypothetical protein
MDTDTISVLQEDGFPTISPAWDMIERAGILNAYLARPQSIQPLKMHGGTCKTGQMYGDSFHAGRFLLVRRRGRLL